MDIWTFFWIAYVLAFLAFIGVVGAAGQEHVLWVMGTGLPGNRFYGLIFRHPDWSVARSGEWKGVMSSLALTKPKPYHGHYRCYGLWMVLRPGPRRQTSTSTKPALGIGL